MEESELLLRNLGVRNCTKRHLQIINEFIINKETDCEKLLNELGDWDANDLELTKSWLKELSSS